MAANKPPSVNGNALNSSVKISEEEVRLVESRTDEGPQFGLCGRATRFIVQNLALLGLLALLLVLFGSDLAAAAGNLLGLHPCKSHWFQPGRVLYDCPAPNLPPLAPYRRY